MLLSSKYMYLALKITICVNKHVHSCDNRCITGKDNKKDKQKSLRNLSCVGGTSKGTHHKKQGTSCVNKHNKFN